MSYIIDNIVSVTSSIKTSDTDLTPCFAVIKQSDFHCLLNVSSTRKRQGESGSDKQRDHGQPNPKTVQKDKRVVT